VSEPERKKRVLVLDDEPDVVTYLQTLLDDHGYETLSAHNGRDGLDIIKQDKPDLVTLDISMPEGSGTSLYKQIKTDPNLVDIPVVIVTAVTDEGHEPHTFRETITTRQQMPPPEGYIEKPIDIAQFLKIIDELLS
jgi:CheY-like chemotaxis protein